MPHQSFISHNAIHKTKVDRVSTRY